MASPLSGKEPERGLSFFAQMHKFEITKLVN